MAGQALTANAASKKGTQPWRPCQPTNFEGLHLALQ
jgi:hypothetical protein